MRVFNLPNKRKDRITFAKRTNRTNRVNKINENIPRGGIRL